MDRQGVHARAEAEWRQALDLEKKLKASSRKRSFYDSEVRSLRRQLRDTYESLLFLDAAFAAANDVEGQMWRSVFYLPIEEFRTRIRKAEKEAQQGSSGPVAVGAPDAAAIMAKTAAAFLKFLDEAALFYKRLVMQLQSAYGDVKVRLELPAGLPLVRSTSTADADGMQISTGSSIARDMRTSIHRCLVFLGDLSRYASQAAPKAAAAVTAVAAAAPGGSTGAAAANTAAKAEWSKAVGYYRMAAHVLPRSGNPHNQLAVMAFMTGEELKAAYHYARSLCVSAPFMTARENLLQLLQSNRDRYLSLLKQRQLQQQQGQGRPVLPMQQQLVELGTCYVRLVGLLYDRINQHEYPHVAKAAFEGLAAFLDHPQLLLLLQRQRQYDCAPLHMVVLSIFVVHHSFGGVGAGGGGSGRHHEPQHAELHGANGSSHGHSRPSTAEASAALLNGAGRDSSAGGFRTYAGAPSPQSPIAAAAAAPGGAGGTYGDAAQRTVQRGRSLAMLFRTGRLLAQAATAAVNAEAAAAVAGGACNGMAAAAAAGKTGATCLLVGLNVVLQWLAAQPNCAVLQAAVATEEDVKARSKFWTAASQLLLVLAPALDLYEQQQRQKQQPAAAAAAGGAAAGPASSAGGGAASGSLGGDGSCEDGALPEELELLGFEPLRSRHYWHVTEVGKHAVDETRTRIKRMLAAARVTSAALAADQQQQLMARHLSSSISPQALAQLSTAVQQFIEVVAMVGASSSTPAASPKVGAAAAAAASAGRQLPQFQGRSPGQLQAGQQSPAGPTAMDIDSHGGSEQGREGQPAATAAAVAAGRAGSRREAAAAAAAAAAATAAAAAEDEEEEVIVFKPRLSRLSSPAIDEPTTTGAAAAAVASPAAAHAAGKTTAAAGAGAAAAGPPPLPQTLLAGRQGGSAAASPPASVSPAPQHQQQQHEQGRGSSGVSGAERANPAAAAGAVGASAGGIGRPSTLGRGAAEGPGGALLQGHAATALDLQQAQAASDMLLARLMARQGHSAGAAAAAAAPGFGSSSMLPAQQQQQRGIGPGLHAPGYAPAAEYGRPASAGGLTAAGGYAAGSSAPLQQQAGPTDGGGDVAMEQALLGTGLAALLGGLGDPGMQLGGPDVLAGAAMGQHGGGVGGSSSALAAVSAAVAASMHAAGLDLPLGAPQLGAAAGSRGPYGAAGGLQGPGAGGAGGVGPGAGAGAGAGHGAMGMDDPLSALGMLGIPASSLGLSVGIPGMQGAQGAAATAAAAGGYGLGPLRSVSAGADTAAAAAALAAGGRKVSAPVGILQQAAAEAAAAGLRTQQQELLLPTHPQQQQQQQQLSSSYVANHQMEETALDAANRVLSPDFDGDSGLALLQQHQRQQQQQQQQQQQGGAFGGSTAGPGVAIGSDLPSLPSRGASWLSGSTNSTPQATTPRASRGLAAALQQQQQQLQAHMAQQRRLSAGSASPRSAVGAERGLLHRDGAFEGALYGSGPATGLGPDGAAAAGVDGGRPGRMSVPSFPTSGAAAAGDFQQQQQRQQRSSIGAMFAGPDLFAAAGEGLPPVHRRSSSGASSGALMGGAAAGAGAGAAGGAASLFGGGNGTGNGAVDPSNCLLPASLAGELPQQQQQQLGLGDDAGEPGEGGLTLVEYLAAQQRKLQQQQGWGGVLGPEGRTAGLQAAAATGADLSAHVLLPPLDFAETQNPFG